MKSLNQFAPFVKRQARRVQRLAAQCPEDKPDRKKRLLEVAQTFDELAKRLEALPPDSQTLQERAGNLSLTPKDIAGLPPEMIDQLSLSDGDLKDFEIIEIIDEAGGVISLNHVMIALYKRYPDEIPDRLRVNARLYRMVQKGLIHSVPGHKGVYSTTPVESGSQKKDASQDESGEASNG